MTSVLHPLRDDDAELARRVAAGDGSAFATLDARHRSALMRYAGTLLRRSEHDAEDVVQDVLIRAHDALRAGNGPDELRPWLFRLTRNRAIDEVRRARWGEAALDSDVAFTADHREEPESVLRRKESIRQLVEDLAGLPVRQRVALLARELDDQTPEQIAERLGVSVMAAHKLARRARENLVRTRDARDAECPGVRVALLDSHERGVRPSEHGVRHVKGCDACRAYQRDVRRLSQRLHGLNPAFGLPLLAGVVHVVGGGGTKAAAGAAAALALAATGGIVVLRADTHSPGEPSPFRLISVRDSQGRPVTRGRPIPDGWTVVSARVRLPAGPRTKPKYPAQAAGGVTLPCPAGMKYAGLQHPERRWPSWSPDPNPERNAIVGYSSSVRFPLGHMGLKRPFVITVGINCRRPDAYGSISPERSPAFERAVGTDKRNLRHICNVGLSAGIRNVPNGRSVDPLALGMPLAVRGRNRTGTWTRVLSDGKFPAAGWIKTSQLCR